MASPLALKTCEVMQYFEHYDTTDPDIIEKRIKGITQLKTWCFAVHDKDRHPDGTEKKTHFHAVLTFTNTKTADSIGKAMHVDPQYVGKIKTTTKSAQLYLVHRNDPAKYQYNPKEVRASFDYVEMVDDCPPKQKRENIADLIANGIIKEYNIHDYVTIDEYARNKRYYTTCFEYRQSKMKGLNRDMECIFITGGSGTGKTTYAKMVAQKEGYATYISSGGKNPLDNYKGEECIILDDTRSSTWSLTDFLKLTDNNTDSLVGCRYYNKSIAECKLLIVTSCKGLEEFYEHAIKEDDEPRTQLYRRFGLYIRMTKDRLTLASYDATNQRHVVAFEVDNPVAPLYDKKVATDRARAFAEAMGLKLNDPAESGNFEEIDIDGDLPF